MTQASVPDPLVDLQNRLQHHFKQPALLDLAMTHRSFGAIHNERLEFLGDAVLGLAISHILYRSLSENKEGELSRIRSNLVRQSTLHQIAIDLKLSGILKFGEGEKKAGGAKRPSILADAVEALIGAVFIDAGYGAAQALVERLFGAVEISPALLASAKDPKTELQELLQAQRLNLPKYTVLSTQGAAHRSIFEVECQVEHFNLSRSGQGAKRRAAEQMAAAAMLDAIRNRPKV